MYETGVKIPGTNAKLVLSKETVLVIKIIKNIFQRPV
jgi:hypothetical protein